MNRKAGWELTVLIVNDKKIKSLNKKFRNKNKVTDVLSFSQREGETFNLPAEGRNYLGDIVISWPQVKRQAKKFGQLPKKELELLIIHGFLHLLGYDDKTLKGWRQMERWQKKILLNI
ncbi:MAG: rRNA maturation RNase YbeY [Candidatus Buchananbacteria bacterium RBG_13_36_9]|uniref:Endoribonuclease YbeY n=1 Tax=Candidatus Buchananbacteria bacterium RBG_13_36_9 TaxID=1797530 RepID=A0A1G1XSQ4_9BACT|nr:MAG: rRNA maturation RNase YbeY [Candidatus Buchananbacteria bacterium RBG_13_36_9]